VPIVLAAALTLLAVTLMGAATADTPLPTDPGEQQPIPEKGFVEPVPAAPCTPESEFDIADHYGNKCKRLRFVFGPIEVKPGQNDLLIQPTTIEQPRYDGYMTRFEPNLIDQSGIAPPVEELHLHHGTWLNLNRDYGDGGPFLASGEEKTIVGWPNGYGMKILADDAWGFLYMVHNATAVPRVVWVTYDVDFVKASDAEAIQPNGKPLITNTKSIWLDVGAGKFHPEAEPYMLNPVYNVQKGFGTVDPKTGKKTCSYPAQNCSRFNSAGNLSAQQGKARDVKGKDWSVPAGLLGETGVGTIVLMGGHLHPGGLLDKVSLVRTIDGVEVERPIHTSEAVYWNEDDGTKVGGKPTSWDFSMTGVSADIGWRVLLKNGDKIRLNAIYESEEASWYENMGIVMSWVAPGDTSGVDVFDPKVKIVDGYPTKAKWPAGMGANCTNSATVLCLRGQITHGQMQENSNHGTCKIGTTCQGLTDKEGQKTDRIDIGGFSYGVADFGVINATGIPRVTKGSPVTFTNIDTFDYMWHTATRCAEPCTGPTTVDYPIANGGNGDPNDVMDFDSSELGVGLAPSQKVSWTLTPDREGTFTFFCRIHPGMRGAIKVVNP
jgi:plastocyanin